VVMMMMTRPSKQLNTKIAIVKFSHAAMKSHATDHILKQNFPMQKRMNS
jgi:hypothetical protein